MTSENGHIQIPALQFTSYNPEQVNLWPSVYYYAHNNLTYLRTVSTQTSTQPTLSVAELWAGG